MVRSETAVLGRSVNGWALNARGSVFGDDYLLRAAVAMDQIYVLPAEEALYPNARTDVSGRELDGRKAYLLTFPADQRPPVDAFWSVTMYHAKGFLVANPASRYSIGDRTSGLKAKSDGSIEIVLQHDRPANEADTNWLPTPSGPFMVMMRLYRPKAVVASGQWAPPGIVEVPRR